MNKASNLVVVDKSLSRVDFVSDRGGKYRAIVKVKAGFLITSEDIGIINKWESGAKWKSAIDVFRNFHKGALQTIEFQPEGTDHWLTVFARVGNKIKLIDNALLAELKIGDINQDWSNTNLYNQNQYQAVGGKTWADYAFIPNQQEHARQAAMAV